MEIHNQTVLDKEKRTRFLALREKLQHETISEKERKEFLKIAEKEEILRNERVKILIQLAQLRNISLVQLMEDLGLKPAVINRM